LYPTKGSIAAAIKWYKRFVYVEYFIVGHIYKPIRKLVIGPSYLPCPLPGNQVDPCPRFCVDNKVDKEKTKKYLLPERPLTIARPVSGGHVSEFEIWEDIYSC
jgi:hypothetical protein